MPTLSLQGISLHYEVTGAGPPLLLLHGLGSSMRDWTRQVAYFRHHYRVVTVDLRGHGQSSKPPGPYRMTDFAQDVASLITALDLAPAHVVGLSMGGMIGFQLAVDRPDLLRTLTVVNSVPAMPNRGFRNRLWWLVRWGFVRLFSMRTVGWALGWLLFPDRRSLRRELARRWAQNDKRAYLASMKAIAGWSVRARLPEITCPTLVLTADHDYTSVDHKRAYTARIPDARVEVIPDTRHALPVEQPEAFNETLLRFLKAHETAGASSAREAP